MDGIGSRMNSMRMSLRLRHSPLVEDGGVSDSSSGDLTNATLSDTKSSSSRAEPSRAEPSRAEPSRGLYSAEATTGSALAAASSGSSADGAVMRRAHANDHWLDHPACPTRDTSTAAVLDVWAADDSGNLGSKSPGVRCGEGPDPERRSVPPVSPRLCRPALRAFGALAQHRQRRHAELHVDRCEPSAHTGQPRLDLA